MNLSSEEIERYARHIVLHGVGGPGQQKLRAARVLVIGAGGLGSPALQYLAAAGVGTLGIIDDDEVALSNLQRQVLHGTEDVGVAKVDSAARAIARLNPHVAVVTHCMRIDATNAREIIRGYDVVAEGSDNFDTRYVVSDACFHEGKPLVTAAVGAFDASLTTLRPFETNAAGDRNPTYRCLFPEPPPAQPAPHHRRGGAGQGDVVSRRQGAAIRPFRRGGVRASGGNRPRLCAGGCSRGLDGRRRLHAGA